jgi:hypothetical protein
VVVAKASSQEDLANVCLRHGLILEEILARRDGTAVFVGRVRDRRGRAYVLKKTASEIAPDVIAALRLGASRGLMPRFERELAPGLFLMEWLPGVTLADAAGEEVVDGPAIGRALRSLHLIAPPPNFPDVSAHFVPGVVSGWPSLPAAFRPLGERFAARLCGAETSSPVFLHGDLVPANVVLGTAGPRLIDPLGRRGLAAWDLAQLSVAGEGRGRAGFLAALLRGYGGAPPSLAEMFAWMALFYLDKNLRDPASPFTANLWPLAEELAAEGDAERCLARYLARFES